MPMNPSGPISLGGATVGQSINLEVGQPATSTVSLNDTLVRTLANIPTLNTTITIPVDFWGKSISDAWFMTLQAPSSITQLNNIQFDSSDNLIFSYFVSGTSCYANISPTGTVNASVNFNAPGTPNTQVNSSYIDANSPSSVRFVGTMQRLPSPTPTVTFRGFTGQLTTSTGAITSFTELQGAGFPVQNSFFSRINTYANGNFVLCGGTPGPSGRFYNYLYNPSFSIIQQMGVSGYDGVPAVNSWWRTFSYSDSAKTRAIQAGFFKKSGPSASPVQNAWVIMDMNQDGTLNWGFRSNELPNSGSSMGNWGFSFNQYNASYNSFAKISSEADIYTNANPSTAIINNFITRFNKTTGAAEQTVGTLSSPGTLTIANELFNIQTSDIDDDNNVACITQLGHAAPSPANARNALRYFKINNPINNTYSAQFNSSNATFAPDNFGFQGIKIATYKQYNYIVIRRVSNGTIGILKIKSDGSSLASGLNVTAPNGFNVQLNPISNISLFSQTTFPINTPASLTNSTTPINIIPSSSSASSFSLTTTKTNI